MKILKYKVADRLYQSETGPEAQVGDQVKLFLDTEANPELPEFVFGIIQPGIRRVNCDEYTIYIIEYELAEFTLRQDDILSAELTAAVDVVAGDLADEVAARIAADTLLSPKASPAFTGNPTAPTPATSDNDTSIATTAFVQAQSIVRYATQTLSSPQQLQARTNIGVIGIDFENQMLIDGDNTSSIDWTNRLAKSASGTTMFSWYSPTHIDIAEGVNFTTGTTTGTQFATTVSQKFGFHGVTPVAQRAGAAQAAVVTTASTITTPYGFTTQAQADSLVTLVNEIRAALVQKGLIKGSA